jgi:hypothetical protein
MKSVRFYKLTILLLILINIIVLSIMWFHRPPRHQFHKGKPPISEIISLTGQAKITVDSLERKHHQDKRAMIRLDQELHHQLFNAIGDKKHPVALKNKLDANKSNIVQMTFEFFNEVSNNCTDNQKIHLKEFIKKKIQTVHRPQMGPRRHPERPKH